MSSANNDSFIPFFPIWYLLFLIFIWFLWLRLPILSYIEVLSALVYNVFVLFLNLEEIFQVFTTEYDISCGFFMKGLYYVDICSFLTHFSECYHEWVFSFRKCFSCIYCNDHIICILPFVNIVCHIDLQILSHHYITGLDPIWSWCIILFMYLG